jgi:hypothetical protein
LTEIINHAITSTYILLVIEKVVLDRNAQRGDMERIRVNTEDLKDKSKVFESSAAIFSQAGKDILSFAVGLPSYDGQLSGPARAAALEINRQCQDVHSCLMNDAHSLAKTARAFEDADNQTINLLNTEQINIASAPLGKPPGLAMPKEPGGGSEGTLPLTTNLDKLLYMISLSKPGDVLQVRMENGELITFIITHDADGNLILWNMNEGRAWDGKSTLAFLADHATDAALYHMDPEGGLELDQTPGARIGDDTKVPTPYAPVYYAKVGIQEGQDDPTTPLPPSFDNGYLQYERGYNTYDGSRIAIGIAITITTPIGGPISLALGGWQIASGVEDFCKWIQGDYTITDVEYYPGNNPPFNPLTQPYP